MEFQKRMQDFSNICQTCLNKKNDLTSIFHSTAAEMLSYCNFYEVSETECLPNKICSSCFVILKQSYNFKKQCEHSQSILKELLLENGTKDGDDMEYINLTTDIKMKNEINSLVDKTHILVINSQEQQHLTNTDLIYSNCDNLSSGNGKESFREIVETLNPQKSSHDKLEEDFISFLDEPLPPPLPFCCTQCNQSFSEDNDLKIHQSAHNPELICLACSKKFTNKQILKRHVKIHLIRKPHNCHICNKSFAESHALTKHLRRHSGIPREKNHICIECGQGFSEPYYLKVHLRKHTGERPLLCTECHKTFADPRSYKIHVMIHSGEKPHKCSFCLKSFIQRANLTKHLRIHTGEKPYLCKICDKRFSQSSSLDKHRRTHTGEKVYSCHRCKKRYSDKSALTNHLKVHNSPKSCKFCFNVVESKSTLPLNYKGDNEMKNVCKVCEKKL